MAILRKDNSQPHDYVVAMRNSESLPRTLWGALQYDSEPHAFVLMSTANKKSNLHTNYQVKVLPMGLVTLGTWCRPAANTFSAVELCVKNKIPSFPNNILPLTLADMPDVVNGKGNGNLDCITDLDNGDYNQLWISASDPNNNSTSCIVLSEKRDCHL
jgi:hypothetical protein